MSEKVLVSGAGVAGACLAWWLDRYGYAVTVVEQAPEPRTGGYVIDFWGLGYDVAEKMGVLDELRRHDLEVREFRIVDRRGRRISGFDQGAVQELLKGRGMSLPRSALASALYEAVEDRVEVRFGDSVTGLEDSSRGVDVEFREGEPRTFDLVVGADGLHSAVRRLCFGEDARFERFLGYYVAAFTAPGYRFRDPDAYVTYGEPGRQIWRITVDEDTTVFMLVFADPDPHAAPVHDASRQKEVLRRLYSGGGWETHAMLHALEASTDLYFDRVSQIVMPSWTKGRVALIGDACACPSLLAGEGASMAMAEAYTLAGELAVAQGDHVAAFERYERRLRPYVERKQKGARGFAASFVPGSACGLWLRNAALNAANRLGLIRLLFGAQMSAGIELQDYRQPWSPRLGELSVKQAEAVSE
jgi:2-polyprenyl-6-methoxyphenol hydroxylase-like FAD-dependent oxidoreductase